MDLLVMALRALGGGGLWLIGLVCIGSTWAVVPNEVRLWSMSVDYLAVQHPAASERVQAFREVGVLDGAGNHCDFAVGELRRSPLGHGALLAHYGATGAEVFSFDAPFAEDNYAASTLRWRHGPAAEEQAGLYLVYFYDGLNSPEGDLRCW